MRNIFTNNLSKYNSYLFWCEAEKTLFLLNNLNTEADEYRQAIVYSYSTAIGHLIGSRSRKDELLAVQMLYAMWSSLSIKVSSMMELNYEINEWFMIKLECVNQQIFENVAVWLDKKSMYYFYYGAPMIFSRLKTNPKSLLDFDKITSDAHTELYS